MTLWKQGASAVPVLARLRIIFGSAGIGIGRACCPIGTALVTEFAPRRIRATMIVMGVALGGGLAGLVAAQFMSIYGSRARDHPAPRCLCPEQTEPLAPRCACQPTSPISFSQIAGRTGSVHVESQGDIRPVIGRSHRSRQMQML